MVGKPREERERRVRSKIRQSCCNTRRGKMMENTVKNRGNNWKGQQSRQEKCSLKSSMKWFVVEFVTWTRRHENVNCKSSVSSNKGVYCYPTASIYERTFSLRSWAEHVRLLHRCHSAFLSHLLLFVFRVPAAWLVLPFLLVDVFSIVQPTWNYKGKLPVRQDPLNGKRTQTWTKVAFR